MIVMLDIYTRSIQVYPVKSKRAQEVCASLKDFCGKRRCANIIYSDNAPELLEAAKEYSWAHHTSTPGRSQTNGKIERAVRHVQEGARCLLLQAGFPPNWWPMAIACFAFMNNVVRKDGVSAWDRRHESEFKGNLIPFEALINFKQVPVKEDTQMKFAPRSVPGLFLGYFLSSGQRWKGEYLCISLSDYEKESFRCVQRIREVIVCDDDEFKFPIAEKTDPYLGDWRLCHELLGSESTGGVRGLSFPYKDDTTTAGGTKDAVDLDDDPPIDPGLIPRPRDDEEVEEDEGRDEGDPVEAEIPEPKMARKSEEEAKLPGRRSARALWHSTPQHAEHQRRKELGAMTREWLEQLKAWHDEGKDVDIIYDPRPKDPSFPPKPKGGQSSGSGGPSAVLEEMKTRVTMPIAEVTRNIIEFCCDDNSSLGKACPRGCKVMRVTKGMDATKDTTVEKAMSSIEGDNTMVWGSIPCTGGTPWRRINDAKHGDDPEYKRKMKDHER
eukprot:6490990-Amphidinium_carterae.1